ncbi:MutS domain V protein [Segatella baroniae F0067]|uniref:MutS domain V protein n=1 Tax=Segatella baroniae F0067 TaxID=1115809 RepID=U2QI41_9BACT|nr:MutS domain V protein [Segatella baroniae]ERK38467.1 MutS domain V protein [Segatella baroniae F0067]
MDNYQYYTSRHETLAGIVARLKRRNRVFILTEILFFCLFIGGLAAYVGTPLGWTALLLSGLSLACYVIARLLDGRNARRIAYSENLQHVYQHELEALQGDYSHFDDGRDFVDYHHPFTFDLDVFGPRSLYARMNRSVTSGGRRLLASHLSFEKICFQPREVAFFSRQLAFMDEFQALGQERKTDTLGILALRNMMKGMPLPAWMGRMWAKLLACCMIGLVLSSVVLAVFGVLEATFPLFYATLQFFLVFLLCNAKARSIGRQTDLLHRESEGFVRLLRLCERQQAWPESMEAEVEELRKAMKSARLLEDFIRRLDRRGNILGLFLLDAFLLNDFFLNHPAAVQAEVVESETMVYEAEGLFHPFLGAEAVTNDFAIPDGSYTIVTGANMAGKSTFLRTLGINYVLARNGIPVFARRMRVSRFNLFSSMRTTDDLAEGISYFNAELLRLEQLVHFCKHPSYREGLPSEEQHTLIILDEILKGTNSLDKLNGSRLFLERICKLPVSGVIATHDLELSRLSEERPDRFRNYCFEIELGENVTYSYRITPGVARNQNATYLLKRVLKVIEE